jgi:hypothetical protein
MFTTGRVVLNTVTYYSVSQRGLELDIGSIDHLRIANTTNYNSPTELQTPIITVITTHIKVFCLH